MSKVSQIEASDRSVEAKAATIVSAQASEPIALGHEGVKEAKSDEDYLKEFESITDKNEQNRYFKQYASQISRAAAKNLSRRPRA